MKNGTKAALHRRNQLLAALEPDDYAWLEPHLEIVELPRGKVVYQSGEAIRHTYFPHDAVVSLVTDLQNGGSVEMAVFGRESVFGFVSALVTRHSEHATIMSCRLPAFLGGEPYMSILFLTFSLPPRLPT